MSAAPAWSFLLAAAKFYKVPDWDARVLAATSDSIFSSTGFSRVNAIRKTDPFTL